MKQPRLFLALYLCARCGYIATQMLPLGVRVDWPHRCRPKVVA